MKNILLSFCFGSLALAAAGTVTVSLNAPVNGPAEIVVRNQGTSPVTAYAYTLKWNGGSRDEVVDSVLALNRRPVFPNAVEVRRPAGLGPSATVEFRAALFADGSSSGDPAWVARLLARRRYALEAVTASYERRQAPKPADADQQQVLKQLQGRPRVTPRDLELLQQKLAAALPGAAAN